MTQEIFGICCKCGKNPIDHNYTEKRLCEPCAIAQSKLEWELYQKGGKVIDKEEPKIGDDGAKLLPFERKPKGPQVTGAILVFTYDDNHQRQVRLTDEEQKTIIDQINFNRHTAKKEFQFKNVAIIPIEALVEIHGIIEKVAAGEDQKDAAKQFLDDCNPK